MKKINLILFIITISSFIFTSCKDNEVVDPTNDSIINPPIAGGGGGGVWNTNCDNETWDGDVLHDCFAPATNCVVVCGERLNSPEYGNFQQNVNSGNSSDYYTNGNGQTFLALHTGAYNDLINGYKKIVKVPVAQHKYALVDDN